MINNDKNNELVGAIAQIAKENIQRGKVVGIYLNAFTEKQEKKSRLHLL